jgi:UDP-N-acetylglucosamine--N-acetylmuramyl-(pentapeptide) pyrophosphoryl-undecaprenol N-acetylglucosamine transferase
MRVIISAGGTGGHIYPALAILNKIREKEPNSEFLYVGTHNRMEKTIIPSKNIPYLELEVYGLKRGKIFENIKIFNKIIKAFFVMKKEIKKFNPDVIIGVGGYVTFPVIMAGYFSKVKTVIHEQNSVFGFSNVVLSRFVDKIFVSFEESIIEKHSDKTVFTGNPCGEEAIATLSSPKSEFGLSDNKKLLYIVLGSLGASIISSKIIDFLKIAGDQYEIMFITGKSSYEEISKLNFASNIHLFPYIENQTRIMKQADLIITRCGASTLSEIISLKIPSILIPSPFVPNDHQYKNALSFSSNNAGIILEEKDVTGELLLKEVNNLIFDDNKLSNMKSNLAKMEILNSATKIYEEIRQLI